MKFSKTTLGSAVLAATLATALSTTAFAQTNTNSSTKTPDQTDVNKKSMAPKASGPQVKGTVGASTTNSGQKTLDQTDVDKRASSKLPAKGSAASGAATVGSGAGATNTNSGTKTLDETDVDAKKKPGAASATTPAPRR